MAARAPGTVALAIRGPLAVADVPALREQVARALAGSRVAVLVCDLVGVHADAATVDALARLHLAARREGCRLHVRDAPDELLRLIAFMGLADVLSDVDR